MAKQKKQIFQSRPLIAFDLGGDSIRAMAAEYTNEGLLRVLGVENSNLKQCVERGIITSTGDAGYIINETLKKLANRIREKELPSVFVCLGGKTMQITEVSARRDQVRKREVTEVLLDDMERECKEKIEQKNPNVAVLDLIPTFYVLDGEEQEETPETYQRAALVEGHYTAFVGQQELETKVKKSFQQATKYIEHAYVRPDALFCALTEEDDPQRGCAIIDMGAHTTTLSIYKGNQYLYTKVIPQGGYDITMDIARKGTTLPFAEKLKCEYGMAMPQLISTNCRYKVGTTDPAQREMVITTEELAQTIYTRLEEMMTPLLDTVNAYSDRIGVLYITGGASMLQGILDYIETKVTIPVLYGSHARYLTIDTPDEMCYPNYSSLIGTLLLGAHYRQTHPQPVVDNGKFKEMLNDLANKTISMFTDSY